MIRKILIGLLLFVVLSFVGLYIFVRTFDINKYLPQITQQVSQTIGRQVTIDKAVLNLSINQGIVVDVMGIALAEDPQFSKESFVSIQHVHCGVSLLPFFTKQQIAVNSIEIKSPEVHIIRNASGVSNYESIIEATKPKEPAPSQGSSSGAPGQTNAPVALPKLLVNSFQILDAKIVYVDQAAQPPVNLSLEKVDAKVIGFSLTDPFKIQLDAAIFAQAQNIHIDGTGRIDPNLQQARLDDVRFSTDLSLLNIEKMHKDIAGLSALGLKSGLSGTIEAVISQMVVGSKGLLVLSLDGKLSGGRIALKMLASPIEALTAKLDVTESRIKMSDFSFNLGSGQISGSVNVNDYLTLQSFETNTAISGLILEEVIEQASSPVKVKGALSGTVKLSGQGFSPEAMDKILGQAEFGLTKAELVNVNIIKSILEKIPVLSALSEVAGSQLTEDLQNKLGGSSTKISQAKVKSRIELSKVFIDDAQISGEDFTLASHGSVGFDQAVDLDAELRLSKETSESLIESAKDMDALLDENGEIHFPVKITGKIPDLTYMPDLTYISKLLIVNKGGGQLQKVLEKNPEAKKILDIFTGGDKSVEEENDGGEEEEKKPDGKKLLKDLLKGF